MKGLVHIYTGNGKGKTTAAVGLGVRAFGRGFKVLLVQFLKGSETGELISLKRFEPGFMLHRGTEVKKFTWDMNEEERQRTKEDQRKLLSFAVKEAGTGSWNLLILDEILGAISSGMVDLKDVAEFVKSKPEAMELVLTGRNAPAELIELADYVSEINPVKHPMNKGIRARKGIES